MPCTSTQRFLSEGRRLIFLLLRTQNSALSTQHSALSTQNSALSTQHSALTYSSSTF
ncbi:hypothetical protein [Nostoc sp. UHCC 0870]|uniref:hypothetical protein n=1 Tax=Nostoc sp. UHCC 0870 TaxID=2914041 RepID=UPI0030DC8000